MTDRGPAQDGPTVPPGPGDLATVLRRNIARLRERREEEARAAPLSDRIAERVTDFAGSMSFILIHALIFGAWIGINLVGPEALRFDPTLVALAMAASVEAIFLSTLVLITQNRMAAAERKQAELDLQINLLTEHEVTRLIDLVSRMADQMGVGGRDPEIEELRRDVAPDAVLDTIGDEEDDRHEH